MATDLETVRLLIADKLPAPDQLFTDAELQSFLDLNGANVRRAAAEALEVISTSELLVSKVIRTQDLQTDGAKVATELRARAADLRKRADETDDENGDFAFLIVDTYPTRPELTEYPFEYDPRSEFWGL